MYTMRYNSNYPKNCDGWCAGCPLHYTHISLDNTTNNVINNTSNANPNYNMNLDITVNISIK